MTLRILELDPGFDSAAFDRAFNKPHPAHSCLNPWQHCGQRTHALSFRQAIRPSANSRYSTANASMYPSGWPPGSRVTASASGSSSRRPRAASPLDRQAISRSAGSGPPDATRSNPFRRTRASAPVPLARRHLRAHQRAARSALKPQQRIAVVVELAARHHSAQRGVHARHFEARHIFNR
jgi:hypothetical protein